MRFSNIVIAAVITAGAVAGSTTVASAAAILEDGHFTSESGTDNNGLQVQNDLRVPYIDVVINGVDLGPLLPGATSAEVNVGDPAEGSGTQIDMSIWKFGATNPHNFQVTALDLDANGQFSLGSVAVPEPATWAMMLIGLGGLGAVMRRRAALAA
jgi:hypothetical protein